MLTLKNKAGNFLAFHALMDETQELENEQEEISHFRFKNSKKKIKKRRISKQNKCNQIFLLERAAELKQIQILQMNMQV